jgi:hypothetical protein
MEQIPFIAVVIGLPMADGGRQLKTQAFHWVAVWV